MINDITILDTITETADMSRDSLNHVLEKASDPQLKSALKKQFKQYDKTYKAAEKMLLAKGKQPQQPSSILKAYAHIVANMKTLTANDSTSKIAEMVIQGSTMGITEMTKQLHNYQGNNRKVRELAENHIQAEQANVDEMKKFL